MKKYEILIVDDEKDVANAMRDALKILEIYNPTVALNGSEALGYIAQRTFDAFMVDQIMPEMTGTEFVRKLTAQVSDPLVYIITAEDDGVALSAAELQSEKGGIPVKKYVQKPWQQSLFTVDLRADLMERDLKRELLRTVDGYSKKYKEIQTEMEKARNEIALAERKDSAMIAGMAVVKAANHEINNINMGFTGCTLRLENFLKDIGHKLAAEDSQLIGKICESQGKLSSRLKEYAGFITSLFTKTDEKKQYAELDEVIIKSVEDVKNEKDCSRITFRKNAPSGIFVECYPKQLRYAIQQIVKNAVESMPEGGDLGISAEKTNEAAVIHVSDSGKGIPEETVDMIFMPLFTRTKVYGGKGGSIAHKIVCENHEGRIVVESLTDAMIESGNYPGKSPGTIVTISLPL
jgi:signal transduction histidine kinase